MSRTLVQAAFVGALSFGLMAAAFAVLTTGKTWVSPSGGSEKSAVQILNPSAR